MSLRDNGQGRRKENGGEEGRGVWVALAGVNTRGGKGSLGTLVNKRGIG